MLVKIFVPLSFANLSINSDKQPKQTYKKYRTEPKFESCAAHSMLSCHNIAGKSSANKRLSVNHFTVFILVRSEVFSVLVHGAKAHTHR